MISWWPVMAKPRPPPWVGLRTTLVFGPVVLHEVHVHRREVLQRVAEVPGKGDGLEEKLGQEHGRTEIDIDAALEIGNKGTEGEKVVLGSCSRCPAVEGRVHVDDVGADGDMDRDRNAEAVAGGEQALVLVGELALADHSADGRRRSLHPACAALIAWLIMLPVSSAMPKAPDRISLSTSSEVWPMKASSKSWMIAGAVQREAGDESCAPSGR